MYRCMHNIHICFHLIFILTTEYSFPITRDLFMFIGSDPGKWLTLCCDSLCAVPHLLHISQGPESICDEVSISKYTSANLFCSFFLHTIRFLTTPLSIVCMNTACCSFLRRAGHWEVHLPVKQPT